jgi:hypothetical protein
MNQCVTRICKVPSRENTIIKHSTKPSQSTWRKCRGFAPLCATVSVSLACEGNNSVAPIATCVLLGWRLFQNSESPWAFFQTFEKSTGRRTRGGNQCAEVSQIRVVQVDDAVGCCVETIGGWDETAADFGVFVCKIDKTICASESASLRWDRTRWTDKHEVFLARCSRSRDDLCSPTAMTDGPELRGKRIDLRSIAMSRYMLRQRYGYPMRDHAQYSNFCP